MASDSNKMWRTIFVVEFASKRVIRIIRQNLAGPYHKVNLHMLVVYLYKIQRKLRDKYCKQINRIYFSRRYQRLGNVSQCD